MLQQHHEQRDTKQRSQQQYSQHPQHVTLYLQHRRALVGWLLEVASVNPLGLVAPSSLAHKAVALLDELISLPRLPLLCAVDPVRLPLMAVACLGIACKSNNTHNARNNAHNVRNSVKEEVERDAIGGEEGGQIFSLLTFLNEACQNRYSEEIIAKMEALLTRIIELARQQKHKTEESVNKEGQESEKENENENEEYVTSHEWLGYFLNCVAPQGKELPNQKEESEEGNKQQKFHFVLSEYANLFVDLLLPEESTYCGVYSARIIAAASLGVARQQLGQVPVWPPCFEALTGCTVNEIAPCMTAMWHNAQAEFCDMER